MPVGRHLDAGVPAPEGERTRFVRHHRQDRDARRIGREPLGNAAAKVGFAAKRPAKPEDRRREVGEQQPEMVFERPHQRRPVGGGERFAGGNSVGTQGFAVSGGVAGGNGREGAHCGILIGY